MNFSLIYFEKMINLKVKTSKFMVFFRT